MRRVTKRLIVGILLVASAGIGVRAYIASRESDAPKVATALVTRGAVADVVAATGTLQAVTTVQVGTQVSGTVAWLGADFNSIVHKDQVIAKLDPSLFETQVEQARANQTKAAADLDNAQVKVADAQQKYQRAKDLSAKQLIAQSDLDAAKVALDLAEATVRSIRAQLAQAQAAVNQAQLNLDHTIITAPIDGIVIGRSVDAGQTVAASLSSPTVFSIAADLTDMQVSASIDESDIGRIRPAQRVTFQVDAYPNERFTGKVSQVRLQPTVVQNVTTYSVIIDVPNAALKLKPGMTANVTIEIAARENVVRVPNAALRFRPTAAMFTALGQTAPADRAQIRLKADPTGDVRSVRLQADQDQIRLKPDPTAATRDAKATTIDALFGPLIEVQTDGRVWTYENNQLKPVPVRLGISDGQTTELIRGDVQPDTPVVTNITTGAESKTTTTAAASTGLFGGLAGPGGPGGPGGGNRGGFGGANRGGR
ncbi:MAG TPA: efflux RND transporter periplasmic adaptor subunit [Vicinamibacterales bacterium]|jgi:HlyD family secretion protein